MNDDAYRERFAELSRQLQEPPFTPRGRRPLCADGAGKVAMFVVLHIGTALMIGGLLVRSAGVWLVGLGLTIAAPIAAELVAHRSAPGRHAGRSATTLKP